MSHTREEKIEAFGRFIDILDILREKCPWDHRDMHDISKGALYTVPP